MRQNALWSVQHVDSLHAVADVEFGQDRLDVQRGQSQLRDLAATRLRLARLAHPRAARSEETTSSAEPVVE